MPWTEVQETARAAGFFLSYDPFLGQATAAEHDLEHSSIVLAAGILIGGAMTGAMSDALGLIRSLKEHFPDETEDQLISRFLKELEGDQALKRAVLRDVFNDLIQELGEGKPPKARGGLAVPRVTPTCHSR